MFERWYYIHQGRTCGPVLLAEAVRLAAGGVIRPDDLFWPEDIDPQFAFKARATLDFASLQTSAVPSTAPPILPNWLDDVGEAERSTRQRKPERPVAPPKAGQPTVPDWLSDVQQAEQFIVRRKLTPVKSPAVVPLNPPGVLPAAKPLQSPNVVLSKSPDIMPTAAPPQLPMATPKPSTAMPAKRLTATSAVPPSGLPSVPTPATPDEMGFDPESGQILDAVKFRQWQQTQQQKKNGEAAASPGESVYEVFFKARSAVSAWVDTDQNWPLIVRSGNNLRRAPEAQRLIQEYDGYGKDMTEKLWHYLEFMAENRRNHDAARKK